MIDCEPATDPSGVCAEEGIVFVEGPSGTAIAFTPEAAEETSHRLLEAACSAVGQKHLEATKPKLGE